MQALETDYLVIGAGALGMAFADSLISHCDADVIMVDRRARPGGHWNDAYSFVRLHQPSAFYGVNSRVLGHDAIDTDGPNAGFYERADAAEICDYFARVLGEQLLASGRVRFYGTCDYRAGAAGEHRFRSLLTGDVHDVAVRRKVVDARYLETAIPATHAPSFAVDPAVRFAAVNALPRLAEASASYVLIGGGKTATDACGWLLDNGVEPERIRWVRPRDPWLLDRAGWQPLEQVATIVEGLSLELEAVARATSVADLFDRLERNGRLLRLDDSVVPTMYRCATVSRAELAQLRRVHEVIRLGRVLRLDADRIVLEHGSIPTNPRHVHVDCSAVGLRRARPRPIFEPDRITLQMVRQCNPPFNAALIGYVEATRDDPAEQNGLCPPNPFPDIAEDWIAILATSLRAAGAWRSAPDLQEWVERSRLNFVRGAREQVHEPRMQRAHRRTGESLAPALANLPRLLAESRRAAPD